jgi:anti-anti-sigma regulatory factor
MEMEKLTEDVIYVVLPPEPRIRDKLKELNEKVSKSCDFNVVIDFSYIEVLTSTSISNLITLQNWLNKSGYKLVFCNVAVVTKCIFDVAGLEKVFRFAVDKFDALSTLKEGGPTVDS